MFKKVATKSQKHAKIRTGEKIINKQGLEMEIIEYKSANNVVVKLNDGYIIKNQTYDFFKKGLIIDSRLTRKGTTRLKDRTGEQCKNKNGQTMTIISYKRMNDMDVLFEDGFIKKGVRYSHFKEGSLSNPYFPSVYNRGYIGEGEYSAISDKKMYVRWVNIISRVYNPKDDHYSAYKDCLISEDFLCFQNFVKFCKENYYELGSEKMQLDKDWLVKGNRTYSKETCVFIPAYINTLIVGNSRNRGAYPKGITHRKNNYEARISILKDGKQYRKYLGAFQTPEEAFQAYKTAKEAYIRQVANEYKAKYPQFPEKLYNAMLNYEVEITD